MEGIMRTFFIVIIIICGWLCIAAAQPERATGRENLILDQLQKNHVDPEKSSPTSQKVIGGGLAQKESQPGQASGTPPQQPPQPSPPPEKAPIPKPAPPQVKPPADEPSGTHGQKLPHPERPQPKPSVSQPSGESQGSMSPAVIAAIITVVGGIIVAIIGLLTRKG